VKQMHTRRMTAYINAYGSTVVMINATKMLA